MGGRGGKGREGKGREGKGILEGVRIGKVSLVVHCTLNVLYSL